VGVLVRLASHLVQAEEDDVVVAEVEEFWVRVGLAFDDREARPVEARRGGEVVRELAYRRRVFREVLAPQLSDGVGVGVDVVAVALVPCGMMKVCL